MAEGPSAAARARAREMRAFDSHLTDGQIAAIARRIDDSYGSGAALSTKKKPLKNADEPLTAVRIAGEPA